MAGHWREVVPRRLKSSHNPHDWIFAYFLEFGSQRADGKDFRAYLFRSRDRAVFGSYVLGPDKSAPDVRDWATRVVIDKEFRERHITDDEELIALWKHH